MGGIPPREIPLSICVNSCSENFSAELSNHGCRSPKVKSCRLVGEEKRLPHSAWPVEVLSPGNPGGRIPSRNFNAFLRLRGHARAHPRIWAMHQGGSHVALVVGNLSKTRQRRKCGQPMRKVYQQVWRNQQFGRPRANFSHEPRLFLAFPILRRKYRVLTHSHVHAPRTAALLHRRILFPPGPCLAIGVYRWLDLCVPKFYDRTVVDFEVIGPSWANI